MAVQRYDRMNALQIADACNRMPAFATAYRDVLRRDADVAENRLQAVTGGDAA